MAYNRNDQGATNEMYDATGDHLSDDLSACSTFPSTPDDTLSHHSISPEQLTVSTILGLVEAATKQGEDGNN